MDMESSWTNPPPFSYSGANNSPPQNIITTNISSITIPSKFEHACKYLWITGISWMKN